MTSNQPPASAPPPPCTLPPPTARARLSAPPRTLVRPPLTGSSDAAYSTSGDANTKEPPLGKATPASGVVNVENEKPVWDGAGSGGLALT